MVNRFPIDFDHSLEIRTFSALPSSGMARCSTVKVSLCIETVAHLQHVYVVRILPPKARSTRETKGEEADRREETDASLGFTAVPSVAAGAAVALGLSCSPLVALPIESLEPRTESPTLCTEWSK